MFEIQAQKTLPLPKDCLHLVPPASLQFDTGLIICSEFEMLLTQNFHLEGFCQDTGHDASPCSSLPGGSVNVHKPGVNVSVYTVCMI